MWGLASNRVRECCWQDSSQGFWPSQHRLSSQCVASPSPALSSTALTISPLFPHCLWEFTDTQWIIYQEHALVLPVYLQINGRTWCKAENLYCFCALRCQLCVVHIDPFRLCPVSHGQLKWLFYTLFLIFQSHFTWKLFGEWLLSSCNLRPSTRGSM